MDKLNESALLDRVSLVQKKLTSEISRLVIGQKEVVEQLLVAMLAKGHVLLIGVPGLAKTTLVKTVAGAMALKFGRIQFTPDLMPSDITGTDIIEGLQEGKRSFRFVKGPLFCNLLLADEINRTPPKTQAALLQAMQENAVTVGGKTYKLSAPFIVFATQNPIEQAGTYPLPEAQLDRFMLQINVGYPSHVEEIAIVEQTTVGTSLPVKPLIDERQILALQSIVPTVPCARHVVEYAVKLIRRTRPDNEYASGDVKKYVSWGAGPRSAQMIILAAKARALLHGRFAVDQRDVEILAPAVLRHRLVLNFEAESRGISADKIIAGLVETNVKW
jgi:MoxR-like ATPase